MKTFTLLVEQMVPGALEIADRGYVIQSGRIIPSGKVTELLESDNVRKAYMGMSLKQYIIKNKRNRFKDI